jgi:hypothetical protein
MLTENKTPPLGSLLLPDDDEVFAAASLVPGEDCEAYKRLFQQIWEGVWPRDGFESSLVHRIMESLWMARRLTQLSRRKLGDSTKSYLQIWLTMPQDTRQSHERARTRARQIVSGLGRNVAKAYPKAKAILARQGKDLDWGVLSALDEENALELQNALEAQIDHCYDRADRCMKQLLKRRERQAVLWVKERG